MAYSLLRLVEGNSYVLLKLKGSLYIRQGNIHNNKATFPFLWITTNERDFFLHIVNDSLEIPGRVLANHPCQLLNGVSTLKNSENDSV